MNIIADYHVHTHLCKHAEGTPEEYVAQARKMGIQSLGFADHCPVPDGYDPINRMYLHEYEKYVDMINSVKSSCNDIDILFGMEVDWVPGRMGEVEIFLSKTKYDYLLGSIHYVDDLPFDHPDHIHTWNTEERIEYVWKRYFELMIDFISWGKFDILAHFDLPKKYSMHPKCMKKVHEMADKVLSLAAGKNIIMELNTSGLRKEVKEIFPSKEILKIAHRNDVKIVFGSDAHTPNDVGKDFNIASELAKSVGYKSYCRLSENGVRKTVSL
jgi:histidinol-phosphatase (PHP family)